MGRSRNERCRRGRETGLSGATEAVRLTLASGPACAAPGQDTGGQSGTRCRRILDLHRPERPADAGEIRGVGDLFVAEKLRPGPVRSIGKAVRQFPTGVPAPRRPRSRFAEERETGISVTERDHVAGEKPSAPASSRTRSGPSSSADQHPSAPPPGSFRRARSASGRTIAGPRSRCRPPPGPRPPRRGSEAARRSRPASFAPPTSSGARWSGRCPAGDTANRGPGIARAPATRCVARESRRGPREGPGASRQSRPGPSRPGVGRGGRSPPRPNGPPAHPSSRCQAGSLRRNKAPSLPPDSGPKPPTERPEDRRTDSLRTGYGL